MKIFQLQDLNNFDVKEIFKSNAVVIPTETVYGLAARIDNEEALKSIYKIKGRPSDNPLIVHVSSISMLENLIDQEIPLEYRILMEKFWPGPLTLLFKAKASVSKTVTGNSDFVAVRMPRNPLLRELISRLDCPLAAPSANTSGKPSPTQLSHVIHDLGEKVPFYIDDGSCEVGLESTIFGIINRECILLRPGGITKEQIEEAIGKEILVKNKVSKEEKTFCPGQKYKHYSPSIPVYLFKGNDWSSNMIKAMESLKDIRVGLLRRSNIAYQIEFHKIFELGATLPEVSRNLFSGLRSLETDCDAIFVLEVEQTEEGLAIMDRLEKASSFIVQ